MSPFRAGRYLLQVGFFILLVTLMLAAAANGIPQEWWIARTVAGLLVVLVFLILVFRVLTNPLIQYFGDMEGETHGSARFATDKETAALARTGSGLLIGRDPKSAKLLRYDGPAHLLTMAPTRTGKGVGTIIPNLLTADRSVICIDPKGENAKIAGRARQTFGPATSSTHSASPACPRPPSIPSTSSTRPASMLRKMPAPLADALVFDEPGMAGEPARWEKRSRR